MSSALSEPAALTRAAAIRDAYVSQDNIDLNRNFIDHTAPKGPNTLYAQAHPHVARSARLLEGEARRPQRRDIARQKRKSTS